MLFPQGAVGVGYACPWGGISPRLLTRVHSSISFGAEGMGRLDLDASHVGDIDREELGQLLFPLGNWE